MEFVLGSASGRHPLHMKGSNMNKYRDYDNYLKEYPTEDGYFGKYGGNYLDDPELIKAFNEYAEAYNTIAQSAQFIAELRRIRKDFQGRLLLFTIARTCLIFWAEHRSI